VFLDFTCALKVLSLETREYSMDQKCQIGEVIEFPFFGKGKVIANLKKGKIEVNFEKIGIPTFDCTENFK
jgi:hypothetical protein